MKRNFLVRWLGNIPIARKLYFTVGIMAMLIAIELFTLYFAITTLSSVRAYVGAEGLWSKAQKDAVYFLQKYARSHDEKDYQSYLHFLKVPLGDHKARIELFKIDPDLAIARQGFLEGRVHPDDIDGAINLFRRFHNIYYISKAISIWSKGDSLIAQQIDIGKELHSEISAPNSSFEKINTILTRLDPLNDKLTKLEDDFSFTLGEGSRWLTNLVLKLLLGLVLTVEICGLSITILVSRSIAKGLKNIIDSSEKITKGDFNVRAEVYSRDEIGILANSFNQMTERLEENIKALKLSEFKLKLSKNTAEHLLEVKEKFLANMSHEIRTPMNAVIGFTDLLESTSMSKEQEKFVHAIKISGQNLMAIINDILDYSKIESGMMVIEQTPFNIRTVFESLEILLKQSTQVKKLELILNVDDEIPELIVGDSMRLTQILLNLANNAIKLTEAGTVAISVRLNSQTNDSVSLEFNVKDTGKGIPEDKKATIFQRFTQVDTDSTRKYGGTGLGLSIVKNLVELQKGTISVQSELNKGSTFSFFITYQKVKANNAGVPESSIQPAIKKISKQLHILVAEDNKINQTVAKHVLKRFGFTFDIADNGKLAIDLLKKNRYDLILMDMQMPEMDGYQATRIIRNELKNNIPIIALTAHAMADEKDKCLSLGMNDYISKPFSQEGLYEKIASFF